MTKQDFELIANVMRTNMPVAGSSNEEHRRFMWLIICGDFSRELRQTNSLFDADKFLTACGLTQEERK